MENVLHRLGIWTGFCWKPESVKAPDQSFHFSLAPGWASVGPLQRLLSSLAFSWPASDKRWHERSGRSYYADFGSEGCGHFGLCWGRRGLLLWCLSCELCKDYESSWALESTSDNGAWNHEAMRSSDQPCWAMKRWYSMILHDTPCAMLQSLRVGPFRSLACSGCRADATYFILHGALRYLKKDHPPCRVRFGQWISEMCLWTEWLHLGDFLSVSHSARNVWSKITWEKWSSICIICANWQGRKRKSRQKYTGGKTALTWGFAKLVAINVSEFCSIIGSAGGVQDRILYMFFLALCESWWQRGFDALTFCTAVQCHAFARHKLTNMLLASRQRKTQT